MSNLSNRTMPIAAIVAFSLSLLTAPVVTEAADLLCGASIVSDIELDADLHCEGSPFNGLIIDANNVTIDLNSFTIFGSDFTAVVSVGFDDVKIENGTITGFRSGVFVDRAENVKLENLVIRDTLGGHGMRVANSSNVLIENLSLFGPPRDTALGQAILLQAVNRFTVDNVDVHGFVRGVLIVCISSQDCETGPSNTDGAVTNSTFSGTDGVVVLNARDVEISGNTVSNCDIRPPVALCNGITVGRSSEIKVENNHVYDNRAGIVLFDNATRSKISANHVHHNSSRGIFLVDVGLGSTFNLIKSNITFENGVDLGHDALSRPNEWKDNSCQTSVGDDIPDC